MIVSSCPLRISLVGGSTDHPYFLEKYPFGSVISFTSNLRTYITLHQDKLGLTQINKKYIANYTRREECSCIEEIENDIIREAFTHFNVPYNTCSMTSDIFSSGSGLASSSSYLISLIKAISVMKSLPLTDIQICGIANQLERKFNPLVGQQDFYGSGIGGLKKITFYRDKSPTFTYLNPQIFNSIDMYLVFTEKNRESTNVLKTIDIDKSYEHLADVDQLECFINSNNIAEMCKVIRNSWITKKQTSPYICSGDLSDVDNALYSDTKVLCHKLCGAGGGGFFLVITSKDTIPSIASSKLHIKITISTVGAIATNIYDKIY